MFKLIGQIFGAFVAVLCILCFIPIIFFILLMFIIAWVCGVKFKVTVDKREVGYLRWFKLTYY